MSGWLCLAFRTLGLILSSRMYERQCFMLMIKSDHSLLLPDKKNIFLKSPERPLGSADSFVHAH